MKCFDVTTNAGVTAVHGRTLAAGALIIHNSWCRIQGWRSPLIHPVILSLIILPQHCTKHNRSHVHYRSDTECFLDEGIPFSLNWKKSLFFSCRKCLTFKVIDRLPETFIFILLALMMFAGCSNGNVFRRQHPSRMMFTQYHMANPIE